MGRTIAGARTLALSEAGKRGARAQFAALCWRRRRGGIEVVLVTGRDTGRWIIPKGWPMDGRSPAEAAAVEAREEAGVAGIASERSLGIFTYAKRLNGASVPVVVVVFPVEVMALRDDWPERKARRRRWVPLGKAAKLVADPDLARLLRDPTLPALLG